MDVLRGNDDTYRSIGAVKGLLPPASAGKGKGETREIRGAYPGESFEHGLGVGLRLTFPSGQLKPYDQVRLLAGQRVDYGPYG